MIGTGVFTSLGFQLADMHNTWTIVLLWVVGGVVALTGAFSYAEVGSYFNRSGGEYHFLSEMYHPLLGYLSGWISLSVGFAAPIALAAMALGAYVDSYWGIPSHLLAILLLIGLTLVHSISLKSSSRFQNVTTFLKIGLILLFILVGFALAPVDTALNLSDSWSDEILLPAFAIALVYVTYSYTGWNAAAYIVGEIKNVKSNLPKALVRGTVLVTVLYVLLQIVFLKHAPLDQLVGKIEVGHVVATNMFGANGGMIISHAIAFFLISSISAMIWVGPRVTMVMAEDHGLWSFLKGRTQSGIPLKAVWFQTAIALLLIIFGTFEQILLYCGFILQISSALCVAGSFIIRRRGQPLPYKSPFHPVFPILFLVLSVFILGYLIIEKPQESLWGMINLLIGAITYFISKIFTQNE